MTSPLLRRTAACLALGAPLVAQNAFVPVDGAPIVVTEQLTFTQKQGKVATTGVDGRIAIAFASALGNDVDVRFFGPDLAPLTGDVTANDLLDTGVQDEPSVAMDAHGRVLVAWSDRAAYDGELMGIFARLFDDAGAPLGPEFQVNQTWQQSQWEPLVHASPGGGFVVAWSGNADGDAYVRAFDTDGVPLGDEVEINVADNNAQIDTAAVVGAVGTMLATWVDFGGNGPGSGTNVFARILDVDGTPLGVGDDFVVHETVFAGAQRSPAVDADGLGSFVVVWDDLSGNDGDGDSCWARRFDPSGNPLTPEILVNQTTVGNQFTPQVASDWVGNFVVTWEDDSQGAHRIMARRFDASGQPLGDEVQIDSNTSDDKAQPHVVIDPSGEDVLFVWNGVGPGTAGDVLAERWRFAPIEVGPVSLGAPVELSLDLPGGGGLAYVLVGSFGTSPGLPLADGRTLQIVSDLLFDLTLAIPNDGTVFSGFQGVLDPDGRATAVIHLPPNPSISGIVMHYAAVTVDDTPAPNGSVLRHVTQPVEVVVP